jgi:hypothetical protein
MSRYFARLAQRTGLAASAHAASAAKPAVPDIIEQNVHVDAAPVPASASANVGTRVSRDTPSETSAGQEPARALRGAPVEPSVSSSDAIRVPAPQRVPHTTDRAAATPTRMARSTERKLAARAAESRSPNLPSAAAQPRQAPASDRGHAADTSASMDGPDVARPSIDPAPIQPPEPMALKSAATHDRGHVTDVGAPRGLAPTFARARIDAPRPSAFVRTNAIDPPAASRGRGHDSSTPTAVETFPPPPTATTSNVEVRIGAVRLEIHPPAPAASVDAPPSTPAHESRRFTPGRYYLRG